VVGVEKAGVETALGEAALEEFGFEVLEPEFGCLGDSIEALLQFEADVVISAAVETAGKMDKDVVVEIGLDERVAEVNAPCLEIKEKSEVEDEANGGPLDNRCKGVGDGLLQITSNAPARFEAFNGTIRVAFAAKSPGAWKNFVGGSSLGNDGPSLVGDEGGDFFEHGCLPFSNVVGVDGLIVGKCVWITCGGNVSSEVGEVDRCVL
jgi:hypothetical protein